MMKFILKNIASPLLGCIMVLAVSAIATPRSAQAAQPLDEFCSNDTLPSYSGSVDLPQDTYDVYVRLGKRGQTAPVTILSRQDNQMVTGCRAVGSVTATADRWTLVGQIDSSGESSKATLQLISSLLTPIPDANRPSLMLVSTSSSVCRPTEECEVVMGRESGYIHPGTASSQDDSLLIVNVVDPRTDSISEVLYYADNKLMYRTAQLQPFDLRYASYSGQNLVRVIHYNSGQRVVMYSTVNSGFIETFPNFVFKLAHAHPGIVRALVWISTLLAILAIARIIIGVQLSRYRWKVNHGLLPQQQHRSSRGLSSTQVERMLRIRRTSEYGLLGLLVLVAASLLALGTYNAAIQIYTVNGESMERAYSDGDRLVINRLPHSLATINKLEYIPQRGDVIVADAVYDMMSARGETDDTSKVLKRVIGLPGEKVHIENGRITIYNKKAPQGFDPDSNGSWGPLINKGTNSEIIDLQLGPSEIFVLGDNRNVSNDSRFNGPLNVRHIVGPVIFKL